MFDVTENKSITYTIGETVYTEEQFQRFSQALSKLQLPVPVLDPEVAIHATVTVNEVLDFEAYSSYQRIVEKIDGTISFAKIIAALASTYQVPVSSSVEEKPKRGKRSPSAAKPTEPITEPVPLVSPPALVADTPNETLYSLLKEAGQEKGGFVASELVRFIHASDGIAESEKTKIVSRLNAIVDGGKVAPNAPEVPAFILAEAKRLLREYVAEEE